MLADNSRYLLAAAQQRHDNAHQRAQEAIRVAAARGEAITATALANRAGVSRAFLYANPDLIEAIRELRGTGQGLAAVSRRHGATDASLQRRLEALAQRNKDLRTENQDLRRRLEVVYGQLRSLESGARQQESCRPVVAGDVEP